MGNLRRGVWDDRGRVGAPVRVLVADDHPLFAKTLVAMLAGERRIEVIGCAANGRQAVELTERLQPDVVLMDISMPILDGFAATRLLRERGNEARVLILTASAEPDDADRALRDGAYGYLTKDRVATELVPAVLHVAGVADVELPRTASRAG